MANRYVAIHQNPNGPGDARPTAIQIVKDEQLEGKLSNHNVFITGCSSGIGVETAKALFLTGANLYLTARNIKKAKVALGDIANSPRVVLLHLNLDSFASVKACAKQFWSQCKTLNILILNAGVGTPPEGRTEDGFETQFGSNHLSHFLLFNLLQPALLAGVTPPRASRVVVLSSAAHRVAEVDFDDVNFEGRYDPMATYGQSKTANLWTANEIDRRYGAQGIHAWSVQPGIVQSEFMRHLHKEEVEGYLGDPYTTKMLKNTEQGAATTVWAATAAALEEKGGKYLDNCQIIGAWDHSSPIWAPGYGAHAYDTEKAKKLWEKSIDWVGL